jgi:hypothetical protein
MGRWTGAATLACAASLTGCGAAGTTTLSARVAGPHAETGSGVTPPGEQLLRASGDRPVDIEGFDSIAQRWALVCTTPCEQTVPAYGTYRVAVRGFPPSRPFGWSWSQDPWIVLRIDPDGRVWTRDSQSLRAHRSAEARAGAATASMWWSLSMLLMNLK